MLYSTTDAAPQFLVKLTSFIQIELVVHVLWSQLDRSFLTITCSAYVTSFSAIVLFPSCFLNGLQELKNPSAVSTTIYRKPSDAFR